MSTQTFVLVQNQPASWLTHLQQQCVSIVSGPQATFVVDGQASSEQAFAQQMPSSAVARVSDESGMRLEARGGGQELTVVLDEQQQSTLTAWVAAHGDDFAVVFRPENKLKVKSRPVGVRLKAGQSASMDAPGVMQELSRGILDLGQVTHVGQTLTVKARGPRLIPESGWLGRMGRYDVTITIDHASGSVVQDPQQFRAIPVTVGHFDPACELLHLGSPEHGFIEVQTTACEYGVAVDAKPAQVRRWRKWQSAK